MRSIQHHLVLMGLILALPLCLTGPPALAEEPEAVQPEPGAELMADTLQFEPVEPLVQENEDEPRVTDVPQDGRRRWLVVPFNGRRLTGRDAGRFRRDFFEFEPALDYNRVDELRIGLENQVQGEWGFAPRLATRIEYTTGRRKWLYGVQLEQPLEAGNRLAIGVSMSKVTDHHDLQQVGDFENSLALLFGRQDYRDYFEREGAEAYVAARWPHVTTASVRLRGDRYRSLDALDVTSWFHRGRMLRDNPPIVEGDARSVAVRLQRRARKAGGLYHWIELENAGGALGGDFGYRRVAADLRSLIRLSPAMSLSLRALGGSGLAGTIPPQKSFVIGGVDGLRAHPFGAFRGDQAALGQAEYTVGVGRFHRGDHHGLHAIVFADAGTAWSDPGHHWDLGRQHFALDGGFGLGTADDDFRVYFARDLRRTDSNFVISARLRRPF